MQRQPTAREGGQPFRDIYTVSRLNLEAKAALESGFPPLIWIEGEISNLARPASGHVYFSLKDDQSQIRCALFRTALRQCSVDLENGMQVLARTRVSLYETRGDFQLIIEQLEDAGEGALRRAFEALKQRLGKEGLFDLADKKPLPRLPRRIGIITSPSGAVLHDILTTLKRRFPAIPILLHPVPVQGEGAAEKIAAAIHLAATRKNCDALILARGGGSLEDLWAFNEEIVARAIYACALPIVCGVGHETDFTIADLAADVRAPTPTAAAEMLSPDQGEWLMQFRHWEARLYKDARNRIQNLSQRVDGLGARVVHPRLRLEHIGQRLQQFGRRLRLAQLTAFNTAHGKMVAQTTRFLQFTPRPRLRQWRLDIDHINNRLLKGMDHIKEKREDSLQRLMKGLHALSPLATLARGYAIIQRPGVTEIIRNAMDLKPGEVVEARLHRGRLTCAVENIDED